MRRFMLLLLCALTMVSLGTGSVAHAAEASVCVEQAAAHEADAHGQDDSDKADKGRPDHHVNCHGHQLASLGAAGGMGDHAAARTMPVPPRAQALHAASADPALRPPQA